MANNIYSALEAGISSPPAILRSYHGERWAAVETDAGMGMCMYVPGCDNSRFAAINAFYNQGTEHFEPFENYYTSGLDFSGKRVGVVGHLAEVRRRHGNEAREIFVFELEPKAEEDLPAEMEEELLPSCDIVIITGSSLVNGTLPRLLELAKNAYTILTGPSVPMCPALFDFGIDRLAGLCITDLPGMRSYIKSSSKEKPYSFGAPFPLKKP